MEKQKSKPFYDDFTKLKKGDIVFDLGISSMSNGFDGWTYNKGERVLSITNNEIITNENNYNKDTLLNKKHTAYKLYKYQNAP